MEDSPWAKNCPGHIFVADPEQSQHRDCNEEENAGGDEKEFLLAEGLSIP